MLKEFSVVAGRGRAAVNRLGFDGEAGFLTEPDPKGPAGAFGVLKFNIDLRSWFGRAGR